MTQSPAHPAPTSRSKPSGGLAVLDISAGYASGRPVIHHVQAWLRPGRLTVLVGPNASGKTTLLRTMLGQLSALEGEVRLEDRSLERWRGVDLARRVSYLPQRGGVGFGFTVRQMVEMGRFAFDDHRHADAAMDRVGIRPLADRPMDHLSGGQQQRVLMARAWAQSRGDGRCGAGGRAVLADEPTTGLDPAQAWRAMGLLREMADEGLAVLVVLHDLNAALQWADEVWLMAAGRLVAAGPASEVLRPDRLGPVYGVRMSTVGGDEKRRLVVDGLAEVAKLKPGSSSR